MYQEPSDCRTIEQVSYPVRCRMVHFDFVSCRVKIPAVVETTARRESQRKESGLELYEPADYQYPCRLAQFEPYITEIDPAIELHEDILCTCRIATSCRIAVDFWRWNTMRSEKVHARHFASNQQMFGLGRWVRYTGNHLEAIAHGQKKGAIETTFGELLKLDKVLWASLDGGGGEICKFLNIE